MHPSTFEYLKPTPEQIDVMLVLREAAAAYANILDAHLPSGPDKTFILRSHRTNAMWANVAVTRHADGGPREPDFIEQASVTLAPIERDFVGTRDFRSHKDVKATVIRAAEFGANGGGKVAVRNENGETVVIPVPVGFVRKAGLLKEGDILLQYPDGYLSWIPADKFNSNNYTLAGK